jgi:hypothetical protein
MEKHNRPRTTALIHVIAGVLLALNVPLATAAEELILVIAPRSTLLTAEGTVEFDVYLYNKSDKRRRAPAPDAEFNVVWTLRDMDKTRPERNGSHVSLGTDAVSSYALKSQEAVSTLLMDHFESKPGDLLEFHISIKAKSKDGQTNIIQSNPVLLYRDKE